KNRLHAWTVPRRRGRRVQARVDDQAAAEVAAQPAREDDAARLVDQLLHVAGHALGGFERVHREVELLHPPADEMDQRPAERPEEWRPLRPDVEVVAAGVLVEIA